MFDVIKNVGKKVSAFQLGAGSEKETEMIAAGKIKIRNDGTYELFSQEAVNGTGQVALPDDYAKIDNAGYPYPNSKAWFEENHEMINGEYFQKPKPLQAWDISQPDTDDIYRFLVDNEKVRINPQDPKHYFNARLWDTDLSAESNAVIVIYKSTRDADGKIIDVDFNFVDRDEFKKTYNLYK